MDAVGAGRALQLTLSSNMRHALQLRARHSRRLTALLCRPAATMAPETSSQPVSPSFAQGAAHLASSQEPPTATLPPRPLGVTDGPWDRADADAVRQALQDAAKISRQSEKYGGGDVILGKTPEELTTLAAADGQPSYRAKQLLDAVLQGARGVTEITTIPKAWRQTLAERGVRTGRSLLHHEVRSSDGTRKFLLQLHDGLVVESVGIPVDDADRPRLTVCVSSQVGCPMRCTFCATGKGGFARNLMPHEIVDQVLTVQEQFGKVRNTSIHIYADVCSCRARARPFNAFNNACLFFFHCSACPMWSSWAWGSRFSTCPPSCAPMQY